MKKSEKNCAMPVLSDVSGKQEMYEPTFIKPMYEPLSRADHI